MITQLLHFDKKYVPSERINFGSLSDQSDSDCILASFTHIQTLNLNT